MIGGVIGLAGGALLGLAHRRQRLTSAFQQIDLVALPLLCKLISEMSDASMFIASFVAGLTIQIRFQEAVKHCVEFAEELGQLLNLSVFFLLGMVVVRDWPQFGLSAWLYAVISLTVVRMVPVAAALIGTHLSAAGVIFMGWFRPRGLASIVLGLVYLEQELRLPGRIYDQDCGDGHGAAKHLCSRTQRNGR